MESQTVRAVLARAPALNAAALQALLAAAAGELPRMLDPVVLERVALAPHTHAYLTSPETRDCQRDLDWIRSSGAQLILIGEDGYPPLLAQIPSPPPVLFVLGDAAVLQSAQIAMVGARNPTPGGRATALDFAAQLTRAGLTITSGLAVGIDAASHAGALQAGGRTVAVCGTGLDEVYPRQHADLARRILERGTLVSELPPRSRALRGHFPRRNRLISGLSRGTVVVEAAFGSGSLQTACCATRQGRKVFAVPGSIHNPLARGCHQLIRQGAELVEEPGQVLSRLEFSFEREGLARSRRGGGGGGVLDNEYEMLLDALALEPATVDLLAERLGFPCASVASMLLILELEGRVAPHPGGRYGPLP
jgi:DNA processing protein